MTIETYGTGERLKGAAALLADISPKHMVLLPVPTTKDRKFVTGTDIGLEETLLNISGGSVLVGYALPGEYKAAAEALGAEVIDLAIDEAFLRENAYLTALGALGYIITTSKKEIGGLSFGIIGYGRIGKEMLRLLLFLGARVRVYTGREETALMLASLGVAATVGYECELSSLDILINTAPCDLSHITILPIPSGVRIIELASGENFGGNAQVERLAALPERAFPESAADTYARAVKRLI